MSEESKESARVPALTVKADFCFLRANEAVSSAHRSNTDSRNKWSDFEMDK